MLLVIRHVKSGKLSSIDGYIGRIGGLVRSGVGRLQDPIVVDDEHGRLFGSNNSGSDGFGRDHLFGGVLRRTHFDRRGRRRGRRERHGGRDRCGPRVRVVVFAQYRSDRSTSGHEIHRMFTLEARA